MLEKTWNQKQQINKKNQPLPLWSGLSSCLLAIQSPESLVPFYLIPHQLAACRHHSGTRQFPCVESELRKCIK